MRYHFNYSFTYVCFEKSQVHKDKNTTSGSDHTHCVFYDPLGAIL